MTSQLGRFAFATAFFALSSCGAVPAQESSNAAPAVLSGFAGEHIVRDDFGSCFCVLRRPDDLVALRAQFNDSKEGN